jgi:hypothetical protein
VTSPAPLHFLTLLVASWLGRRQGEAIEYLRAENRVLRARLGPNFVDGDQHARLEWEMLVGEVAMVIFGDRCFWRAPEDRRMTRDEVRRVVVQLAAAMGAPVELAFADGKEVIGRKAEA